MDYIKLGNTGMDISPLALGCMTYGDPARDPHPWTLSESESRPLIRQAVDAGINFFDTANICSNGSSEEIVGKALAEFTRREEVVICHKVGTPPPPIEETLEALHDVVKAGKVRYIGASSMAAWQFSKALYLQQINGWTRFVTMQDHYNLVYREEEREMFPLCADQKIGVLPWSPLARGKLPRDWDEKTNRSEKDEFGKTPYSAESADRAIADAVRVIAERRGVPHAQVALAWVLSNSVVSAPIVGASKPQHLHDALSSLELKLTAEEKTELETPYVPHEIAGY